MRRVKNEAKFLLRRRRTRRFHSRETWSERKFRLPPSERIQLIFTRKVVGCEIGDLIRSAAYDGGRKIWEGERVLMGGGWVLVGVVAGWRKFVCSRTPHDGEPLCKCGKKGAK